MLFVSSKPIEVKVFQDRKVIVLTNNKIMFSQIDFIQQYLAMPLISVNPKKMYYQPTIMQTLVVSDTTIQIYYCDWKTQIKLIRVLILNNENVEGIGYEKQTGWQIFGSLAQYEPTRVCFHKIKQPNNNKLVSKCFINQNKYLLSNDKLQKSEKGGQFKQVWWKDRMMVLKNCNYNVVMEGSSTLDKKKDIIAINDKYVLIASRFEIVGTIVNPTIVFYNNNLLMSNINQDTLTTIKKYQNNQFVQIGTINKKEGKICSAFLYEQDLIILIYQDKQIQLISLPLVQQKQTSPSKKQSKKKVFQYISRIMEESHQQGSQFLQKDHHHHEYAINKIEKDFNPKQKPIIKDISVNDEQIKTNSLNQGPSQVLSRSGIDVNEKQGNLRDDEFQDLRRTHNIGTKNRQQNEFSLTNSLKNRSQSTKLKKKGCQQKNKHNNIKDSQRVRGGQIYHDLDKKSLSSDGKSLSIAKSIKNKTNNNKLQNQNISGISSHSLQDYAQTPGFNFEHLAGSSSDKWGLFDNQWNQVVKDQINQDVQYQLQQSVCIEDQKSMFKGLPDNKSLKIQTFCPHDKQLTASLYNKIQKSSYCSLVSKELEQDPDRIEQFMDLFLPNILQQSECPLFFEKNIRTFNPQFTQDKIKKLFKSIINLQQMKPKMTSALQLFKLSQVPKQILSFPNDFLKVLSIICKDIYIEDILKPSQATISYILDSYFNIDSFIEQVITIEDQQIDITHPRNMLNILLYLNEYLCLKIQIIVKVYCSKLFEQNHLDILKKIAIKENIFQICDVPRSVLDDIVTQRFNQLLHQSVENAQYLWSVIQFFSQKLIDLYTIKLAVITQLNKNNIIFELDTFLNIKQKNHDIFTFLQKIITENSCMNLIHLRLGSIYKSLYWIQEGQKLIFVTNQYIQLVKILAEKLFQKKYFYYSLKLIDTILPKVKLSFIIKLFLKYLNCKLINRLCQVEKPIQSLETIFPELMDNPNTDEDSIVADKIVIPQFSKCFSCSWNKFLSFFQRHLKASLQLKLLVFTELNIANQLFLLMQQNQKRNFQKFMSQINENIIIDIDDINQNDQSLNPKGKTSLRFEEQQKNQLLSQVATSTLNREEVLLNDDNDIKKKIVYKSMTIIDHFNQLKSHRIQRRNSDQKIKDDDILDDNQDLMRVKLLVNKNQIIEQLCQIYQNKQSNIFMRSLQLVDHQKVKLYHIDIFKSMMNKQIQYPLTRILPFKVFLSQSSSDAFQHAKQKIKSQVNAINFWVIFAVVQLMFNMGKQVCKIFINKCVEYFRSDNFNEAIRTIFSTLKPKLDWQFIKENLELANDYHLQGIANTLQQYKLQITQ